MAGWHEDQGILWGLQEKASEGRGGRPDKQLPDAAQADRASRPGGIRWLIWPLL